MRHRNGRTTRVTPQAFSSAPIDMSGPVSGYTVERIVKLHREETLRLLQVDGQATTQCPVRRMESGRQPDGAEWQVLRGLLEELLESGSAREWQQLALACARRSPAFAASVADLIATLAFTASQPGMPLHQLQLADAYRQVMYRVARNLHAARHVA